MATGASDRSRGPAHAPLSSTAMLRGRRLEREGPTAPLLMPTDLDLHQRPACQLTGEALGEPPRIVGLPWQVAGSVVMRSRRVMAPNLLRSSAVGQEGRSHTFRTRTGENEAARTGAPSGCDLAKIEL